MKYLFSLLTVMLVFVNPSFSQLTLTPLTQQTDALPYLLHCQSQGSFNTSTAYSPASALFEFTGAHIGSKRGFVLSTGQIASINNQPNGFNPTISTNLGLAANALMSTFFSATQYDCSMYQYTAIPEDSFKINVVLASSEPSTSNPGNYYDGVLILVSGPNPFGGSYLNYNIALVPGSNNFLTTGYINSTVNSGLYVANDQATAALHNVFNFRGYSVPLHFSIPTIPGESYTITVLIADFGDPYYDSAVFLWTDSQAFELDFLSPCSNDAIIEEGMTGHIRVSRTGFNTDSLSVQLNYFGSLNTQTDVIGLPTVITLPPACQDTLIPLFFPNDQIIEVLDSLIITYGGPCQYPDNMHIVHVYDSVPFIAGFQEEYLQFCTDLAPQITPTSSIDVEYLNFQWSTGDTGSTLTLPNGNYGMDWYYLTVSSVFGHIAYDSLIVVYDGSLEGTFTSSPSDCGIDYLNLSLSGGIPPYNILWSNGNTTTSLTNLFFDDTGLYTVTITDFWECSTVLEYWLDVNQPVSTQIVQENYCLLAGCDLHAVPSGGVPPYTYLWSNGSSDQTLNNPFPGYYSLVLIDANNCMDLLTYTLDSIVPLTVDVYTEDIACLPGVFNLSITGGTPPYNVMVDSSLFQTGTPLIIESGWISYSVEDATSCTFHDSVFIDVDTTVTLMPDIHLSYSFANSLHPCILSIDSIGTGYTYLWSTGETTAQIGVNVATEYFVIVSDTTTCYRIGSISVPPFATFQCLAHTEPGQSCLNTSGNIYLELSYPEMLFHIEWSNGETNDSLESVLPGIYSYTITDFISSYSFSDSVYLGGPGGTMFEIQMGFPDCDGGVHDLEIIYQTGSADSSFAISLSSSQVLLSQDNKFGYLPADNYLIQVIDSFGCLFSDTLNLIQPTYDLISSDIVYLCQPDSLQLDALIEPFSSEMQVKEIPFNYIPPSNGTTVTGFYDDSYRGPFPLEFEFPFYGVKYDSFYVASNGWISFLPIPNSPTYAPWNIGEIPSTQSSAGHPMPIAAIFLAWKDWIPATSTTISYFTTGTSPNREFIVNYDAIQMFSCTNLTGSFQVVLHESSGIIDINILRAPMCPNWNDGLGLVGMQNENATKAVTVDSLAVCAWEADSVSYRFFQIPYWFNEDGLLLSSGPQLNQWIDSSQMLYASLNETCFTFTDSVYVQFAPEIPESNQHIYLCENDGFILTAQPGHQYVWSTGETSQSIQLSQSGTYYVQMYDYPACAYWDTMLVQLVYGADYISLEEIHFCENDSVLLQIDPSYQVLWNTGETSSEIYIGSPGVYECVIFDQGCFFSDEVNAVMIPLPQASFYYSSLGGFSYEFVNQSLHTDSWVWDFGDGTPPEMSLHPAHTFPDNGIDAFLVTLEALNGCGMDMHSEVVQILGVGEYDNQLSMFPNPAGDMVYLQWTGNWLGQGYVEIENTVGQKLHRIDFSQALGNRIALNLKDFAAGTYWVKIHTDDGAIIRTIPLIINH